MRDTDALGRTQVGAYTVAWEEMFPALPIHRGVTLHLTRGARYTLHPVDLTVYRDEWLRSLQKYKDERPRGRRWRKFRVLG